MTVFSSKDSRSLEVWGPTSSVNINVPALSSVVDDTWLLVDMSIGAAEIVDIRQCFDDVSYIYALGNDQSKCSIVLKFVIFIGRKKCRGGNYTNSIVRGLNSYASNRISQKTSPSTITIGTFSRMGWLRAIEIGGVDPAKGICYGTATFIMELKK